MADAAVPRRTAGAAIALSAGAVSRLDRAPSWSYQLFFRFGLALLFGYSGWTKLSRWDNTLKLFRDFYKVPLLPPQAAAVAATAVELTMPWLLLAGLATRCAAAAVGMTLVIQLFVLPKGYHAHALWLGPILYLLLRGPGVLSLDHLIRRNLMGAR